MIASLSSSVLTTFLIFCRVGTCLMVAPGYSRSSIPVQIRLFLAVNVTLMLSPLLDAAVRPVVEGAALPVIIRAIVSELMIGLVIGLTARVFFLALETMATLIASAIGLSGIAGTSDDGEHVPALVPLITLSATVLFFMTDQHWELLRGLISSYRIWLPAVGLSGETGLGSAHRPSFTGVRPGAEGGESVRQLRDYRQFGDRACQQAHADHSCLLHITSFRALWRTSVALSHGSRSGSPVLHCICSVA